MPNGKVIFGTGVLCAAAVGLVVFVRAMPELLGGGKGAVAGPQMMAMPVPVTKVSKKTIALTLDYPARTESLQNINLQARISGYLLEQVVPDGSDVKAGDLLFKIDPRDYEATLAQMKSQAARDAAALDYARSNLSRGTELAKTGFLAKDTYEQRLSALNQAEAALAMDKAGIQTAELNLGYTEIRAPFAGRLGRHQSSAGSLVSPGAGTILNTLVQLNPIYVTFNPSEQDLVAIGKARGNGSTVKADVIVPGENEAPHQGELTFLDNVVDRATGTITARATIANGDFGLLPGQYVRVRLYIGEAPDSFMVPQAAVGSSQLGKYVYVVGKGSTVEQRFVTLGANDGELVRVVKGVNDGEDIIDGNLQKIGPGMPVQPLPHPAK